MRLWPLYLVVLGGAAAIAVASTGPPPLPPLNCPEPIGVYVNDDVDGRSCAVVLMSDDSRIAFCEPITMESHEGADSRLEESRA